MCYVHISTVYLGIPYHSDKHVHCPVQVIFELNQKPSNLSVWEKIPEGDSLSIAYMVDQYRFMYEPIYVARSDSPPFDERFVGYGMTRNTQVNSSGNGVLLVEDLKKENMSILSRREYIAVMVVVKRSACLPKTRTILL